jgi:WD40 repeat protein
LWNITTGKPVAGPVRADGVSSAGAVSPDGTRAVTGDSEGRWRVWELPGLKPAAGGELGEGRVHRIVFAPGGQQFTALLADYRKRLGDPFKESRVTYRASTFLADKGTRVGEPVAWPRALPKGQAADQPRTGEPADWTVGGGPAFGKDGRPVVPTGPAVAALEVPGDDEGCGGPMTFAISPDRTRAASAGCNGRVVVWDYPARTVIGEPLAVGDRGSPARRLAFSADGRRLAVVCSDGDSVGGHSITVCDLETRAVVAGPFKTGPLGVGLIDGLAFTPDGSVLAAAFTRRGGNINAPTSGVQLWAVAAGK